MDQTEAQAITLTRAAKILGCGRRTVARMIDSGKLESVPLHKTRRVLVSSVMAVLRSRSGGITAELDEFVQAVERGRQLESPFTNFTDAPDDLLLDRLKNCTAILPDEICASLVIPRGSTFGHGARELRRWLASQQVRAVAA